MIVDDGNLLNMFVYYTHVRVSAGPKSEAFWYTNIQKLSNSEHNDWLGHFSANNKFSCTNSLIPELRNLFMRNTIS